MGGVEATRMFPLGDENSGSGFPAPATLAIIALNVAAFVWETSMPPSALSEQIRSFAVVPAEVAHAPLAHGVSLFTSMFLHGSWMHLIGNMLFLYIFGDNVEELLGSGPFTAFYILCGLIAGISQVAMDPSSTVPVLGASGAVAGVLGAYAVTFPRNRVKCLYFLGCLIGTVLVPAGVFLVLWFVLQLLPALSAQGANSGIAFAAHAGGFAAGALLVSRFPQAQQVRDEYERRTDE